MSARIPPTPSRTVYVCPYCGNSKPSANGTGSDVACCGEVGHSKVAPVTMTGYLGMVSEYWDGEATACKRCEMYDGPGRCGMLHDPAVPVGDCLGLLERDNIAQPEEA